MQLLQFAILQSMMMMILWITVTNGVIKLNTDCRMRGVRWIESPRYGMTGTIVFIIWVRQTGLGVSRQVQSSSFQSFSDSSFFKPDGNFSISKL